MDTSKEYIEMCKNAVEIQELWNIRDNDVILWDNEIDTVCTTCFDWEKWDRLSKTDMFWLPRQDQLQDMYYTTEIYDSFLTTKCVHLVLTISSFIKENVISLDSMEQLWLAFVMKEKFDNVWNGDDWV